METDLPSSDHSGEDVHEHSDIDETSLESDVGNIAYPNLIQIGPITAPNVDLILTETSTPLSTCVHLDC